MKSSSQIFVSKDLYKAFINNSDTTNIIDKLAEFADKIEFEISISKNFEVSTMDDSDIKEILLIEIPKIAQNNKTKSDRAIHNQDNLDFGISLLCKGWCRGHILEILINKNDDIYNLMPHALNL